MTEPKGHRRQLSYQDFTACWYVPGETHIVDLIHPDDGLTLHYKEDAAAVQARYQGARRMSCEDAWTCIDMAAHARYCTGITEVSEDQFLDALNVLPPAGWTTRRGVESFRISERIWGNITDIYARLGERYFKFADDIRLPADIVAERVAEFVAEHPHATLQAAPSRPDDEAKSGSQAATPKPEGGP